MAMRRPAVRVADLPRMQRKLRSPRHTFRLQHQPFIIQPFMIAPVLPGETLKNLTLQAKSQIFSLRDFQAGWWCEYYFFYVKHRDLDERDELIQMALDPSWSKANVDVPSTEVLSYSAAGSVDYVNMCLHRVVDEYFRDEDENYATAAGLLTNGRPMVHVDMPGWMDSMLAAADLATEDVELLDISALTTFEGADDKLTVGELERARQQWELLRSGNLTNQTYEEFLATYGIRPAAVDLHRPELIRYVRDWKYPSLVTAGTQSTASGDGPAWGIPAGSVAWNVSERADKDRRFTEPGFIFGVTVVRPKTYFAGQLGHMAGWLDSVKYWMPPVLSDDPNSSVKIFTDAAGGGPFGAALNGAIAADMKDLFMHGDQFINFALSDTRSSLVSLPDADAQRRYVSQADVDALFYTSGAADAFNGAYQDGVVSLSIASVLEDTSDTTSGSVI